MPVKTPSGRVTLLGAGPGDPELLTIKGARALGEADVVLVDELVGAGVLAHCRPGARVVQVGKRGGCRSTPQAVIERLMIREARGGRHVVRLKGGDPCVFGRGGEELARLRAAGVPVTVINGVSAGIAAPAAAGIPLTLRGVSQGVIFVTGHAQDADAAPDWAALAATRLTIVIYMGMHQLPAIIAALQAAGLAAGTPVAVVENATLPVQRVLRATLADVLAQVESNGLGSPAIVIVGEVAAAEALALSGEARPAVEGVVRRDGRAGSPAGHGSTRRVAGARPAQSNTQRGK